MSERRILFDKPGPRLVQLTVSRMDETPAREDDIPHYALWADGSEYEVFYTKQPRIADVKPYGIRRYHGPQFGRAIGDWHQESL